MSKVIVVITVIQSRLLLRWWLLLLRLHSILTDLLLLAATLLWILRSGLLLTIHYGSFLLIGLLMTLRIMLLWSYLGEILLKHLLFGIVILL